MSAVTGKIFLFSFLAAFSTKNMPIVCFLNERKAHSNTLGGASVYLFTYKVILWVCSETSALQRGRCSNSLMLYFPA